MGVLDTLQLNAQGNCGSKHITRRRVRCMYEKSALVEQLGLKLSA